MPVKQLAEITANDWPEELRSLPNVKERLFVQHYVENGGNAAQASRDANFGGTNPLSAASIGYRLLKRPRVHDAVLAYSKRFLRSLVPKAVNTVREIIDDPQHKDRLKAAREIIDRTDAKVSQVTVEHNVHLDPKRDSLDWLRHLKAIGAPRQMLEDEFGPLGLEYFEGLLAKDDAKIIEGEFVEIEAEASERLEALDL